jgi:tRNA threonylcarbamoyladenosine modification (KEOPS) complex Cgi121 subunit
VLELRGVFGKKIVGLAGAAIKIDDVNKALKKVTAVDRTCGTTSQLFDASRIAGGNHLVHAARLALTARATEMNFASSLGIELVCWVAAERQIGKAFEKVGLRKGVTKIGVLTIGDSRANVKRAQLDILCELSAKREDNVLELSQDKLPVIMKIFSVSKPELEVADLQKLVLERVALLALEK